MNRTNGGIDKKIFQDIAGIIEKFESNEVLTRPNEREFNIEQLDESNPNYPDLYFVDDTEGCFNLDASLALTNPNDSSFVEVKLTYEPLFEGEAIVNAQRDIVRKYSTDYFESEELPNVPYDLGVMEIPRDYDSDDLENSIEAGINRFQEAQTIHDLLQSSLEEYRL